MGPTNTAKAPSATDTLMASTLLKIRRKDSVPSDQEDEQLPRQPTTIPSSREGSPSMAKQRTVPSLVQRLGPENQVTQFLQAASLASQVSGVTSQHGVHALAAHPLLGNHHTTADPTLSSLLSAFAANGSAMHSRRLSLQQQQ